MIGRSILTNQSACKRACQKFIVSNSVFRILPGLSQMDQSIKLTLAFISNNYLNELTLKLCVCELKISALIYFLEGRATVILQKN